VVVRAFRKLFNIFLILVVGVGILGVLYELQRRNLAPTDSDALIGGQLEYGYPATGYLVNYMERGGVEYCGMTLIGTRTAITAAHCLDAPGQVYIGFKDFTINQANLAITTGFAQKPGWDQRSSINDIAVVDLGPSYKAEYPPAVLPPQEPALGCKYRIVAYGRTDPNLAAAEKEKPRKSALLCLNNIEGNVMIMYSGEGGICLGDSGSPVYEDGTNRLIGVISAVKKTSSTDPFCYIGNTAYVVRTDNSLPFITASSKETLDTVALTANPTATGTPAGGTFITFANNVLIVGGVRFTVDELIPIGLVALIAVLILAIIVVINTGRKEENQYY
jgi:V8-like Glu-specific endopeptidase